MIQKILSIITGAPAEKAVEYFQRKAELKQELKIKKLEGKVADQQAKNDQADSRAKEAHAWGMAHIANSGWKDEFVLLVIYIPVIMGFIPGLDDNALAGFAIMAKMPIWYQALVVTVSLAIYGIRATQGKNIVGRLLGADK